MLREALTRQSDLQGQEPMLSSCERAGYSSTDRMRASARGLWLESKDRQIRSLEDAHARLTPHCKCSLVVFSYNRWSCKPHIIQLLDEQLLAPSLCQAAVVIALEQEEGASSSPELGTNVGLWIDTGATRDDLSGNRPATLTQTSVNHTTAQQSFSFHGHSCFKQLTATVRQGFLSHPHLERFLSSPENHHHDRHGHSFKTKSPHQTKRPQ